MTYFVDTDQQTVNLARASITDEEIEFDQRGNTILINRLSGEYTVRVSERNESIGSMKAWTWRDGQCTRAQRQF